MIDRPPIARAIRLADGKLVEQWLADHLYGVASLAEGFCRPFGAGHLGYLAGLWHDLGKYAAEWQHFIRKAVGLDQDVADAHIDEEEKHQRGPDHATAGGLYAIQALGPIGQLLAQIIVAHHSGLFDAVDLEHRLQKPDKATRLADALASRVPRDVLEPAGAQALQFNQAPFSDASPGAFALALRMVFSALVDADRLDSEAFGDPTAAELRKADFADLETLKTDLDRHLAGFIADTPVKRLRADILADCRLAAERAPGLFTLTVPTGGGKTLSSLAFALAHARKHGLKRVIYVIPYTSIIEQTADVFRSISAAFSSSVIEHHSNVDEDGDGRSRESERSRLATENWDAPVIVTTSVQFFESLFAAKTSRARKLHNICESVVILDEAQLLPPPFLQPIVDALNLLARHYRTSIVVSTATQPALASRKRFGKSFRGLDTPHEIISDVDRLYRELKRVQVQLPDDLKSRSAWPDIGERLAQEDDVLAIVGRRADARELWNLMPEGTLHLSALMCGAHRSEVIAEIKRRLAARRDDPGLPPVRVVSTQLVEAGVDLDFPVVYRAFAGLDSIAQAAGRCNREGRLPALGRVEVFMPPKPAPAGTLRGAEDAALEQLHDYAGDPLARELFEPYFACFYNTQDLDAKSIIDQLAVVEDSCGVTGLRTVSERFKLIDNDETGYQSVLVPYRRDENDDTFAKLVAMLKKDGPARWLMRKLQRYSVSLPPHEFKAMRDRGDLEEVIPQCWVVRSVAQYRNDLGLVVGASSHAANALAL